MMRQVLRCLLVLAAWMLQVSSWADETLVVVPGESQIDITTDFVGSELKAIGAISGPGDVIIKVTGPPQEAMLSRKVKVGPFWVEGDTVTATGAPSLLFLCATAPIASILAQGEREHYGMLTEGVPVHIEPQLQAYAAENWREAYIRLMAKKGYYHEDDRAIRVFGDRLFMAEMRLPGDVQIGTYSVETLLVKSGKVVGRNVGSFRVRLAGIERWVWNAAHEHAWLFGSLFTLTAVLLGFALNAITYRKR